MTHSQAKSLSCEDWSENGLAGHPPLAVIEFPGINPSISNIYT